MAWPILPIANLKNYTKTFVDLKKVIDEHNPTKIIIGNPIRLNGTEGTLYKEICLFVDFLKTQISIEIILWDERMTSAMAEKNLKSIGVNRKDRVSKTDSLSASITLQSYLDFDLHRNNQN